MNNKPPSNTLILLTILAGVILTSCQSTQVLEESYNNPTHNIETFKVEPSKDFSYNSLNLISPKTVAFDFNAAVATAALTGFAVVDYGVPLISSATFFYNGDGASGSWDEDSIIAAGFILKDADENLYFGETVSDYSYIHHDLSDSERQYTFMIKAKTTLKKKNGETWLSFITSSSETSIWIKTAK